MSLISSAQDIDYSDKVSLYLSFQYAPVIMSDKLPWYRFVRSEDTPTKVIAKVYKHATIEIEAPRALLIGANNLYKLDRRRQKAFLDKLLPELETERINIGSNTYTYHKVRVLSPGMCCCSNRKANLQGLIALKNITSYLRIEGVFRPTNKLAEDQLDYRTPKFDSFDEETLERDIKYTFKDIKESDSDKKLDISLEEIEEYANSSAVDKMILFGLKVYRDKSIKLCYAYVKQMISDGSKLISNYPRGGFANQALKDLPKEGFINLLDDRNFKKLFLNPEDAPRGAILVYSRRNKPGHIEVRTRDGFLSDYYSIYPITRSSAGPLYSLQGVFIKPNIL